MAGHTGFTFYEFAASTRANSFKLPLSCGRNIGSFKGPLLSTHSLQVRKWQLSFHTLSIRDHLYAELIARIQNLVITCSKVLSFSSSKISSSSLRQALSLLYKNQMSCQALPSSLLPVPTPSFFSLVRHRNQN
ncbi:hypothetical protein AVEN_64515-1 [Araneus ventricosus]|uniref:Uncharacterized protein n=1 Tax=Araneus ventricosus TaxID=182803 RepID=A0A4Y2GMZ6_ARAVE|nr:hypothetical protein AVEN_64515-1 [Araneus ventricosus]